MFFEPRVCFSGIFEGFDEGEVSIHGMELGREEDGVCDEVADIRAFDILGMESDAS